MRRPSLVCLGAIALLAMPACQGQVGMSDGFERPQARLPRPSPTTTSLARRGHPERLEPP